MPQTGVRHLESLCEIGAVARINCLSRHGRADNLPCFVYQIGKNRCRFCSRRFIDHIGIDAYGGRVGSDSRVGNEYAAACGLVRKYRVSDMKQIHYMQLHVPVEAAMILEVHSRPTRGPATVCTAIHLYRDSVVVTKMELACDIDGERGIASLVQRCVNAVDPHIRGLHGGFELDEDLTAPILGLDGKVLSVPRDAEVSIRTLRRNEFGGMWQIDVSPRRVIERWSFCAGHVPLDVFPVEIEVEIDPIFHSWVRTIETCSTNARVRSSIRRASTSSLMLTESVHVMTRAAAQTERYRKRRHHYVELGFHDNDVLQNRNWGN